MIYNSRHSFLALTLVALTRFLGLVSGTPAATQDNSASIPLAFRPLRGLTVGDTGYVIGDSEPIVGPSMCSDPVFSPDSESFMVMQAHRQANSVLRDEYRNRSDDTDFSLMYWNSASRKPRVVWSYSAREGERIDAGTGAWFSDSRHYCFSLTRFEPSNDGDEKARHEMVFIDAVHGSSHSVDLVSDFDTPSSFSPSHNLVAIGVSEGENHQYASSLWIIDASGNVLQTVPVATSEYMVPIMPGNWVKDEALNIISTQTVQTPNGPQTAVHADQLNLRTGKIVPQNSPDAVAASASQKVAPNSLPKLRLVTATVPATENDPATTSAYLAPAALGEAKQALISADAYGVKLTRDRRGSENGIVYYSHGSLLFAPLLTMAATELESESKDRLRIETIARLERLEIALCAYAAEKHGSPSGTGDLRLFLVGADKPLKNDTDFRDPATGKVAFIYKFNGGLDPELTHDQEVPIGYMAVEGGRYLLTNRHVTFEPARDDSTHAKSPPR